MDEYRQKLIMSYLLLETAQEDLIDRIINVGMAGEYKEIGDTFSVNDHYAFDVVQFRGTDDFNLNLLLDLYDEMENSMDLIMSVNSITEEEIEEVWPDWLELTNPDFEDESLESYEDSDDEENPNLEDFDNFDRLN